MGMNMKQIVNDLISLLKKAFTLTDKFARMEAISEIFDLIIQGKLDIQNGMDELLNGLKYETSEEILNLIWYRLSQIPPNKEIIKFAEEELKSHNPRRREFSLRYLYTVLPEKREILYHLMSKDPDPWVKYEAGHAILPLDPRKAVEIWLRALPMAPLVLADEILPIDIGQYIDDEMLENLEEISKKSPEDQLIRLCIWEGTKWRRIDYLDVKEPPGVGSGYFIRCKNCKCEIGIRDGHVGEHARCRLCQHEFIIPERPKE